MRWNPAALGLLEEKEVSATDIQYYQGVQIENVGGRFSYRGRRHRRQRLLPLTREFLDGRDLNGNPTGQF